MRHIRQALVTVRARLTFRYLKTKAEYLKEEAKWGDHPDHLLDEYMWWQHHIHHTPTTNK